MVHSYKKEISQKVCIVANLLIGKKLIYRPSCSYINHDFDIESTATASFQASSSLLLNQIKHSSKQDKRDPFFSFVFIIF